jgi:aconitate decarboxylase
VDQHGFCSTFTRSSDRFEHAKLTAGLGFDFETMRISLEFYSCVGSNHTTLDAIRRMQARHPSGAEDVAKILVAGSRVTIDHVGWPYVPQGITSAQLNLPYCVATLLLDGDVFVDQFTEDKIADPDRMRIAAKVGVAEAPEITARGASYRHKVHVPVTLNDGTILHETVEAPRRSEHSFATAADVIEKFRSSPPTASPGPCRGDRPGSDASRNPGQRRNHRTAAWGLRCARGWRHGPGQITTHAGPRWPMLYGATSKRACMR